MVFLGAVLAWADSQRQETAETAAWDDRALDRFDTGAGGILPRDNPPLCRGPFAREVFAERGLDGALAVVLRVTPRRAANMRPISPVMHLAFAYHAADPSTPLIRIFRFFRSSERTRGRRESIRSGRPVALCAIRNKRKNRIISFCVACHAYAVANQRSVGRPPVSFFSDRASLCESNTCRPRSIAL